MESHPRCVIWVRWWDKVTRICQRLRKEKKERKKEKGGTLCWSLDLSNSLPRSAASLSSLGTSRKETDKHWQAGRVNVDFIQTEQKNLLNASGMVAVKCIGLKIWTLSFWINEIIKSFISFPPSSDCATPPNDHWNKSQRFLSPVGWGVHGNDGKLDSIYWLEFLWVIHQK